MKKRTFIYILLGLLAALSSVINNMFSPALPSLVKFFGSTESMVQGGLTTGMLGLALGQLLIGPLSDNLGRRRPLLASMLLFTLTTVCILPVTDVRVFIALRFVQGFTAAGAIAISRSVATDLSDERTLLKAMAVINIVNGVAPIVTPMMGGAAVDLWGWQGVFAVTLVIAVVLTACCACLGETLPQEQRQKRTLLSTFRLFGTVLRNRTYLSMLLHQASALSLLFGNIASCAFIAQHYGLSSTSVGLTLAANGIFLALGAGFAARFKSSIAGVRVSCAGMLSMSIVVAVVLFLDLGFYAYEAVLCVMLAFMGVTLTSSTTLAMTSAREHAGTASALFGAAGFLVGALVSPIVGVGNILHSTALTFVCGALLSTLFAIPVMRSLLGTKSAS